MSRAGDAARPAPAALTAVDQRVVVRARRVGTLRWVGAGEPPVLGVELDHPIHCGTDGTFGGSQPFSCPPGRAMFVPATSVSEYDPPTHAACVIQAGVRGMLARIEVQNKHNWEIYNTLDNDLEHLHIARAKLLEGTRKLGAAKARAHDAAVAGGLAAGAGAGAGAASSSSGIGFESPRSRAAGTDAARFSVVPVEPEYDGPHLTWPLTDAQIITLMKAFKEGKRLHFKYVMQLFAEFRAVMRSEDATLARFDIPAGGRLTVVGDIHGQVKDMLHVFDCNGFPSTFNCYLWNGDFVDRGADGIEVIMVLFAWKILYPDALLLNRGNHEDRSQNEYYSCQTHGCWGFLEEVTHKYGYNGLYARKVYAAAHHCFELLPLATVVNTHILVLHGGLFRHSDVTLDDLSRVNRKRQIPLPEGPPSLEDSIFEDIMWSDPQDVPGYNQSSRNAGVMFGPDVTEAFLALNDLQLIIRSHECVDEGVRWQKGGKLVTVFSASFYGGYPNRGGVLMLSDTLEVSSYTYGVASAKDADATPCQRRTLHRRHIHEILQERICERKPALYLYFTKHDDDNSGEVSLLEWARGMADVLKLETLPWVHLRPMLCPLTASGRVNYSRFLDRYHVKLRADTAWQDEVVQAVSRKLFQAHSTLEQAYATMDTNKDGKIEYAEFMGALEGLDLGLSHPEIYELMRSIDVDVDATIDWEEFRKRFHVSFQRHSLDSARPASAGAGVGVGAGASAGAAAGAGAGAGGGAAALAPAPSTTAASATADSSASRAPAKVDTGGGRATVVLDDWTQRALEAIGRRLLVSADRAREVFKEIDTDNDAQVSLAEFQECLAKLGMNQFSPADVTRIFNAMDADDSGKLDVVEFLSAFSVQLYTAESGSEEPAGWQAAVIERIVSVLYSFRVELRTAFSMFDLDGSNHINASEFRAGLQALSQHLENPLTEYQINALLRYLDRDGDGLLNYEEFFSGFDVVDKMETPDERAEE